MSIKPKTDKFYTYYLGIFEKNQSDIPGAEEYIEVEKSKNIKIEMLFPLMIDSFNKRKCWKLLSTEQAKKAPYIDFVYTNISFYNHKSIVFPKLSLLTPDNYISNKQKFYDKFKGNPWLIDYEKIGKRNYDLELIMKKFSDKQVIIKPDLGSGGSGILVLNKFDVDKIFKHINNTEYDSWTISNLFIPKLHDGYIVSNRVFLLIVKRKTQVESYVYKKHLIYRAHEKFDGDITDPRKFLTNMTFTNAENFYVNRYINFKFWRNDYDKKKRNKINEQIDRAMIDITNGLKDDLTCINDDSENDCIIHEKNRVGFHVYGLDVLVDKDGNIKILEVNAHPAIDALSEVYNVKDRFNYHEFWDEVMNIALKDQYKSEHNTEYDNFNLLAVFKTEQNIKPLYYIPQSIINTYPFIYESINKRKFIKRTKNMYANIDLFYGLRERYFTEHTNIHYYDELINDRISGRMKNAGIINKIQGITYYLASKDYMFKCLVENMGEDYISIVPETHIFNYPINKDYIKEIFNKHKDIDKWILKPVYGSRGLGIRKYNINKNTATQIIQHMDYWKNVGKDILVSTGKYSAAGIEEKIYINKKYDYWILSRYIDNPHLIKLKNDELGRKYNIRFYVLLNNEKHSGTISGKSSDIDDNLSCYVYVDCMLYFAMLEYDKKNKNIPNKYAAIEDKSLLESMKNLTNLEIVNNVQKVMRKYNIPYDPEDEKRFLTGMLSTVITDDTLRGKIFDQGLKIIKNTADSTKKYLRSLNRYSKNYKSSFNLLAYDTLLDENGKLWLIEVNRGPDMVGLWLNIGYDKCLKFFDELFSITLDPHYINTPKRKISSWIKI